MRLKGVIGIDTARVEGFDAFFARRFRSAARFAFLLTGSPAVGEELAQDAFLQMYVRWDDIRTPDAYLNRAVVNLARSWGRRRRTLPHLTTPSGDDLGADALTVRQALRALPERQREAIVLRFYVDLTERETAAAMGCRPGTVKSLVHRGLASLRRELS